MGQVAINQDEMLDYIVEKMGVPRRVVNNAEQRAAIIQEMQNAAAEMQQQAQQGGAPNV